MGKRNSILREIEDKMGDKFSEVKQVYNGAIRGNRVMIMVEGKDDEDFYNSYANTENVYVYPLSGCQWIEPALESMNARKRRKLAGIKDADFDVLNHSIPSEPGIFLTDAHDHEMMCADKERVANVAQKFNIPAPEAHQLFDKIINDLLPFSYTKWYHSIMALHYSRLEGENQKIPVNVAAVNCYCRSIEEIARRINLQKGNPFLRAVLNHSDISRFMARNLNVNRRMLVNGHDFCDCLAEEIKQRTKRNLKKKVVPNSLRSELSLQEFLDTNLAKSLDSYFHTTEIWKTAPR